MVMLAAAISSMIRQKISQDCQQAILTTRSRRSSSNNSTLVLNLAQAVALLNLDEAGNPTAPFIILNAPDGEVIFADTLANLETYSSQFYETLKTTGIEAIGIAETAENIQELSEAQLQAASALGVTLISATDTGVQLSTAEAINFENGGSFQIAVPTNDSVIVIDSGDNLQTLSPNEILALLPLGVTEILGFEIRAEFTTAQLAAMAEASVFLNEYGYTPISISTLVNAEANPAGLDGASTYSVGVTPADFVNNNLTVTAIEQAPQLVLSINADGSVILSVAQALALENASLPLYVPYGDTVTVVDSASTLEGLSDEQLAALQTIGVSAIAANDAPAVFTADQINALVQASIAVLAPLSDPLQNDGTTAISGPAGNHITFDITWDSSVAIAPSTFKTIVEEAFQFYADTFTTTTPVTLYYTVGFGEVGGIPLGNTEFGEELPSQNSDETYADLLNAMSANATSSAQQEAVASLPTTDPTGGATLYMTTAEEKALGLTNADTEATSASNPDDELGIGYTGNLDYSANPNDVPASYQYELIGTVEHEISEGMGRLSDLYDATSYAPMDLFRFSANDPNNTEPANRVLTADENPSYFSINDGATDLGDWNSYTSEGDLGDWALSNPYVPNSYNDGAAPGVVDPITASDVTLMNVLGYDVATPTEAPTFANAVAVTAGQLLVDLTLDKINPGSADPPAGDYYEIIDSSIDIESLGLEDILDAKQAFLSEIVSTDTSIILNVAQAAALEDLEGTPVNVPVVVPSGDTVKLVDKAGDIEALTPQQIGDLSDIHFNGITSTNASLQFDVAQAVAIEAADLTVAAPPSDAVTVADTAANLAKLTTQDYTTLEALGVTNFVTETPCFSGGTLIHTGRGEVPVEDLAIGDKVMTKSGALRPIKWIGRRSYSGRFVIGRKDILPICIKAGALDENVPRRDLWISPHHAMYLDGVLIEAKDLVNGVSIVQTERVEKVEYFHIELDSHDVIVAEGALSESFIDDDSRGIFHNAHEYRALYPEAAPELAQYCAPRHEDGYEVEAVRQRIDARAGLRIVAEAPTLRGYVDAISLSGIAGWAQIVAYPEAPVCLDIYAGGNLIGRTLANRYRKDLEQAGLGSGCHSFAFAPPAGLIFAPDVVEVRRSLDGASLLLSSSCTRNIASHENRAAQRPNTRRALR